jgi:hypothetical protein
VRRKGAERRSVREKGGGGLDGSEVDVDAESEERKEVSLG